VHDAGHERGCARPHLLELLLLARRDVDLGTVLHVCGGNHRANAGPTTSDHGYRVLSFQRCVRFSRGMRVRTDLSLHVEEIWDGEVLARFLERGRGDLGFFIHSCEVSRLVCCVARVHQECTRWTRIASIYRFGYPREPSVRASFITMSIYCAPRGYRIPRSAPSP
jgi:hypothetical protein